MIYGKMWYVVKPSIGVPIFFAAIAATALLVHVMILTHTAWYPAYLEGHPHKTAAVSMLAPPGAPPIAVQKS